MYVLEELHNESPHTIREYSFTVKFIKTDRIAVCSDCRQNAFGQHSRSVFLVLGSKSVYLINNKHF